MVALVWISLIVSVLTAGIAGAIAAVRGVATWRAFARLQDQADTLLLGLEQGVAGVEERLGKTERASGELADAQARLRVSLAEAAVLVEAFGETRALLAGMRAALPVK